MFRLSRRCLSSSTFSGLLLAALILRALVPVGFMPAMDRGFSLRVQLCTTRGFQTTVLRFGKDGGRAPPSAPAHDAPCLYSVSSTLAPPPFLAPSVVPIVVVSEVTVLVVRCVAVPSIIRAQSARAPPALV